LKITCNTFFTKCAQRGEHSMNIYFGIFFNCIFIAELIKKTKVKQMEKKMPVSFFSV